MSKLLRTFVVYAAAVALIVSMAILHGVMSFRISESYRLAKEYVSHNPAVAEELQGIRRLGWRVLGEWSSAQGIEQRARLRFAVYGRNGKKGCQCAGRAAGRRLPGHGVLAG